MPFILPSSLCGIWGHLHGKDVALLKCTDHLCLPMGRACAYLGNGTQPPISPSLLRGRSSKCFGRAKR
jgi:hypothetical protein